MVMSLSLIDGVVASERHETSGNPVEMNLVIATTNIVTSMSARVEVAWLRDSLVFNTCLATLSMERGQPEFRRSNCGTTLPSTTMDR
jgi:hypothetical protein